MGELGTLKTILSETHTNIIANPDFAESFPDRASTIISQIGPDTSPSNESNFMLELCRDKLEHLLTNLKQISQGHRLGWRRFKGAFLAKDIGESVRDLSRQYQFLNRLLSIDGILLGLSISKGIKQARKEQDEFHDLARENFSVIRNDVEQSTRRQEQQEQQQNRKSALEWLGSTDYTAIHHDHIRRRQEGTGQWLLDCAEFQGWFASEEQTLFCVGIPGAGKTILSTIVVDYLTTKSCKDLSIGVAYVYCNFRRQDEQNAINLLTSLLGQLTQGLPDLPDSVKVSYEQHEHQKSSPSLSEISSLLESVAALYSEVFIVIDALDECKASAECRSSFLASLFSFQNITGAKLFATSRPNMDIEKKFTNCLKREIIAADEDIKTYISGNILKLPTFISRRPELIEDIKTKVSGSAKGMFLLAQLHLSALKDTTTVKDVKTILRRFEQSPKGSKEGEKLQILSKAYNEAMERINGQNENFRELALNILLWISCALRPLSVVELQNCLAVELGETELDEDNIPDIEMIVSVCAGLVTIDEESNVIRLVHYTTQEYFEETQKKWFPEAQVDITKICVTYLAFNQFKAGVCRTREEYAERLRSNPFYDYAAKHWGKNASNYSAVDASVMNFLTCQFKTEAAYQVLGYGYLILESSREYPSVEPGRAAANFSVARSFSITHFTGVHMAAALSLGNVLVSLLATGLDPHSVDSAGETPLTLAARFASEAVIRILLADNRVNVNAENRYGQTGLSIAARRGDLAVIKLFITAKGVDFNIKDNFGETALCYALRAGNEAFIKHLLDTEAFNINSKSKTGLTPLHLAAWRHNKIAVKVLLEKGAHVNARAQRCMTPLFAAVFTYGCDPSIFKLLCSTLEESEGLIKILLEHGADPTIKHDNCTESALSLASNDGHTAIVALMQSYCDQNKEITREVETTTTMIGEGACYKIPPWAPHVSGHRSLT